jgi:3-mercaptopyruvate sulfurtransferase SseA
MTQKSLFAVLAILAGFLFVCRPSHADPSKYPQFAQQKLPQNVTPSFISMDELLAELKAGKKPLIVDVRSDEEYREAHIVGAMSAPLAQFDSHIKTIPKEGLVVLY